MTHPLFSRRNFIKAMSLSAAAACAAPAAILAQERKRPNIVLMYADDLGYGDVSCYGATQVSTPNIDRLAKEGLKLTHAHSPAATCTPSRYAMLTGEYAWRKRGTNVQPGDANALITPDRYTLPGMLRQAGYTTGVVGKWHLGLGEGKIDWNTDIKPGPLEIGFDYSFLIPATGDRVPCVYVENHRVVGLDPKDPIAVSYRGKIGGQPSAKDHPELLKMHWSHGHNSSIVNGIGRIGWMTGGESARWVDEDMADTITGKAVDFIERNKEKPFFLYFSTHDIHVPRVPHPRFVGKTEMGPRGDAIVQLDWCAGEVIKALEERGLAENTIFIFTSDNGPVLDDGYKDDAVEKLHGHEPSGPLRGGKYSIYDGGTRVPFIVRWPGKVKPGESNALACQIDLIASLAKFTGQELPAGSAPDSFDIWDALTGKSPEGRPHLVEQARGLGLVQGDWKYIKPTGKNAKDQLYNLTKDIAEQNNLASQHPERVKEMEALLEQIIADGHSRPQFK